MFTLNVSPKLNDKIKRLANQNSKTPEGYIIKLIEERIKHDAAYNDTFYLAKSKTNKKRLDKAVEDIRAGKYTEHGLI